MQSQSEKRARPEKGRDKVTCSWTTAKGTPSKQAFQREASKKRALVSTPFGGGIGGAVRVCLRGECVCVYVCLLFVWRGKVPHPPNHSTLPRPASVLFVWRGAPALGLLKHMWTCLHSLAYETHPYPWTPSRTRSLCGRDKECVERSSLTRRSNFFRRTARGLIFFGWDNPQPRQNIEIGGYSFCFSTSHIHFHVAESAESNGRSNAGQDSVYTSPRPSNNRVRGHHNIPAARGPHRDVPRARGHSTFSRGQP